MNAGNNESVEPFTSNMYSRRVLAGEFTVVNKYLLRDLIDRGIWTQDVRNQIMHHGGSVQSVAGMPQDLKVGWGGVGRGSCNSNAMLCCGGGSGFVDVGVSLIEALFTHLYQSHPSEQQQDLYKTVWEIKQKCVIDQAADRGAYICQSQSLNIHLANPTPAQLTSMHFYSWKKGLKTGTWAWGVWHEVVDESTPQQVYMHEGPLTPFLHARYQECTTCGPGPRPTLSSSRSTRPPSRPTSRRQPPAPSRPPRWRTRRAAFPAGRKEEEAQAPSFEGRCR